MRGIILGISIALALTTSVLAQGGPAVVHGTNPDTAIGAPYRIGELGSTEATVSLRDYISSRIDAVRTEIFDRIEQNDKRYAERFLAQVDAVKLAFENINARLATVNEFRAQLSDQSKTFATREQVDALNTRINDLIDRFNLLATRVTTIESSGSPTAIQDAKNIEILNLRLNTIESSSASTARIFGIISAVLGLVIGALGAWLGMSRNKATKPT